ncbi:hypothetical protein Q7F20_01135 [Curtobacterium sp. A7_M15]|uniref:hypothetical protein n=1 Tax=Curtobacterium sp. A7_M15 TaxID=3065241 RepID=UPI002737C6D8|nr:hypothetical protein [Curtobacterium sp. A7_M15]MDP4331966.1 hypothetical protein [Curtobacterium sp. A7_M15]
MRTLLHAPRSRRRSIAAVTLGALALIGSLLVATPASALNDTGTGGVFVPTTGRILDTKNNIGGYSTPMPAKTWRTVQVAGLAGLPDDGSVGAVSVVAMVADITTAGQLFGRPDADTKYTLMGIYGGEQQQNTSFSSVLAVGADGTIQVYAETSARLILDVQGYYTANTDGTAPGGFVPLNGKRVADTRSGTGLPQQQLTTGKSAVLQVTGTAGVPADASAVIVNLVAINSTSNVGFLTPYPTGAARPANSFNYAGGTTTTMQAQVQLSADGKITVYNANSTTDLAIDVQGYFTATGGSGAVFTPGSGRIFDTRATGNTILAGNETRAIDVAGQAGVPVMGSGINSVVLTLTANAANGSGWGRVWANGTSEPDTASLRYDNGTVRSNTITVPVGANGKINLHNIGNGATNFIIDVQGWYANPSAPSVVCPQPYSSDAVIITPDSTAVECTISASPATTSGERLVYAVDSEDVTQVDLSQSASITTTVAVELSRGTHSITAYRAYANGDGADETDYTFTVGDWSASALQGTPSADEVTDELPYLGVSLSEEYNFPTDATFAFTVSTDSAGAAVVWESGEQADQIAQTPGLPEGAYFWHAVVRGSNAQGATTTLTTPTFSFSTSAQAAGEDASGTAAADAGTYTADSPVESDPEDTAAPQPAMSTMRTTRYDPVPACSATADPNHKVDDSFPRRHWSGVVSGGHADLVCGTPGTRGMRHIWRPYPGHMDDWIRIANKYPMGLKPEELMVGALTTTYASPTNVSYRSENDSYTYLGILEIKDRKGHVVRIYTVNTAVGNGNWKVITAFPSNGRKP